MNIITTGGVIAAIVATLLMTPSTYAVGHDNGVVEPTERTFKAFVKHDSAGDLANRLKPNANVTGVISGREDAVVIVFVKEPTAKEVTDVCRNANDVGFAVIHKIIMKLHDIFEMPHALCQICSGKDSYPLEDICP